MTGSIGTCEDCGRRQEIPAGIWWAGWCLGCVDNHSLREKIDRIAARKPH